MSISITKPLLIVTTIILSLHTSTSSTDSFVFGGCTQVRYAPSSPYESNVNSVLTSIVNSAMFATYNNFTSSASSVQDTVYGLFQCRGDLSVNDCGRCVGHAVSQIGSLCAQSSGGALQLEGCFVKYDNVSFLGVDDKTVVLKKCGPLILNNPDALTRRDAVLGFIGAVNSDGSYRPFRVGNSGDVYGVAQCVQDLSLNECQDCLSDAIGRLKTDCATAASGDVYLGKCYVRYSISRAHSHGGNGNGDNNNDAEIEKTLAILIGLIAAVALLIIFVSFLRKACVHGKGGK